MLGDTSVLTLTLTLFLTLNVTLNVTVTELNKCRHMSYKLYRRSLGVTTG